jgi:hypothetical protein
VSTALLIVGCALLLAPCHRRLGAAHPLTVTVAIWLVISLLIAAGPFNLLAPSLEVAVAVLGGLAALCAIPLYLSGSARGVPGRPDRPVQHRLGVRLWVLAPVSIALLGAVTWGVFAYRNAISAVLGQPFDQLDPKLVRWAELYGDVSLSGPASAVIALAPLLGALAVIGGLCHGWWWYLLLPAALGLSMQSPSRTATLSLALTSLFFFLLLLKSAGTTLQTRRRPPGQGRALGIVAIVGVLGLGYFAWVGQQLDKSTMPRGLFAAGWVPDALVQPLLYQLGGVSAFTAQLQHAPGEPGPYGAFGRSVYAVVKVGSLLGIQVDQPQPFASYVDIPVPFNTYTAFGDTYFDLGLAGVLVVFLLLGLVVHVAGRWPWPGHPEGVWVLAVMASVLTTTPLHMRFLDGDVLLQALLGVVLLRLVLRREPAGAPEPVAEAGPPAATAAVPS